MYVIYVSKRTAARLDINIRSSNDSYTPEGEYLH